MGSTAAARRAGAQATSITAVTSHRGEDGSPQLPEDQALRSGCGDPVFRADYQKSAIRARPMQLRVARLCLDCEELHVGSTCPVCASERYAFLSMWLPSEERRRWLRPRAKAADAAPGRFLTLKRLLDRWFGGEDSDHGPGRLRTRASDFVPNLNFEEPGKEPQQQPAPAREPLRDDGSPASSAVIRR